jgi:uncharacterized protein (DUF1015 family)
MAALAPFRALRPAPAVAARVAAVPYDVVNTDEARILAAGDPLSFLHVSRAEIDLPAGTAPFSEAVYERAATNFEGLKHDAPMLIEDTPSLYLYRLRRGSHMQTGLAACYSLEDYERGRILRHEYTRRDKEDDRTRHLLRIRAQTGPVFLTYRARPTIDELVQRLTMAPTLYDFTAVDDVRHTVWRVEPQDQGSLSEAFGAVPALYIADGHHRAASAARARRELAGPNGARGEWDVFLAVAFPHSEMQILPYNRLVRDLAGMTIAQFLDTLGGRCTLRQGTPVPERRGEVSMFIGGAWHTLALDEPLGDVSPADRLDVSRLHSLILGPVLGIGDVRSDTRIDFVGGARGTDELEARVQSGAAAVAFSMHPVDIEDLMHISDGGGIMPPKSTWFEPKLRDGLLSHLI